MTRQRLILCTRGLPASGKTTWANFVNDAIDHVKIISFDDLRTMLGYDDKPFSKEKEEIMQNACAAMVKSFLADGNDVIVHNTHMHLKFPKRLKRIAAGEAEVVLVDFTDVPDDACYERNAARERPVPNDVIARMIKEKSKVKIPSSWTVLTPVQAEDLLDGAVAEPAATYQNNPDLPTTVVVDLDGTLAKHNGRNPYDAARCGEDVFDEAIARAVQAFDKVIVCSGREDKFAPQTIEWLDRHNFRYDALFMRPTDDMRPDYEVKLEIFDNLIAPYYNVVAMVDDRDSVVAAYRRHGLTVWQVDYGDF